MRHKSKIEYHGMAGTKVYFAWHSMIDRCLVSYSTNFKNHGGRGITVCPEWADSFSAFLRDMGLPPSKKHSLDRINNDGNYEPGNCRWATAKQQCRNRRGCKFLTFRGETKTLTEWSEIMGLHKDTVGCRISRYGWTVERALTTPTGPNGRKERARRR